MEIVEFIKENWTFIAPLLLLLVELILFLCKKRSKVEIIDDSLVAKACDLIYEAEIRYGKGNGDKKLAYVINSLIADKPQLKANEKQLHDLVEFLLTLPQKKGGNTDE